MLKNTVALSLLIIALSIAYYFFTFLPKQQADQSALLQQQEDEKAQQAQDIKNKQASNQVDLNTCLMETEQKYNSTWVSDCKSYAKEIQGKIDNCVSYGSTEEYCTNLFGKPDATISCSLPSAVADSLDNSAKDGRNECYKRYPTN